MTLKDGAEVEAEVGAQVEPSDEIQLTAEFAGGLEMLFADQRQHTLTVPARDRDGKPASVAMLVDYLCRKTMTDSRRELFVADDGHVRAGILVLINDTDWELEGEEAYELRPGDCILFVSTLHGG